MVRSSNDRIVFSIVSFSVDTMIHEPLHSAW